MKVKFFALAVLFILTYCSNSKAQANRSFGEASYLVTVNGVSVKASNLYTLDSLKSPHFASFDIDIISDPDSKKVFESLFAAAAGKQTLKLNIATLDYQNRLIDQRDYNGAMVAEIDFPELTPSSKDALKLKIKILSQDMNANDAKGQSAGKLSLQTKRALAGNFKIVLGNLPTTKVTAIANLKTGSFLNTGYFNFNIEVARVDADKWKDWFRSGAGGGKTEEGTITLMDQTMGDLAYLQIAGVEIVAVSESNPPGDALAKTMIGLRAKRLSFTMK